MSSITQKGATSPLSLQANGTFQQSTDANLATLVGSRYDLSDGREVVLVSVGSSAIASAGVLCQDAAIVPNHQNIAVTAFTAYSSNGNTPASAQVTLGATALTANQYSGGYALVNAGPGSGQTLRIASNASALSSGTGVTLTFEDAPNTALTTASKLCLLPPHGGNVIIFPTTATGAFAGVTLYALTAGISASATTGTPNFGFLVSKGVTSCFSDATVASVGQAITYSVGTAGDVTLAAGTTATLGYANQTAVSAEARSIFIDV